MKAITLHQPWASLIALGVKTIETRSWTPPKVLIGERLLIHAAVRGPFVHGPPSVGPWNVGTDGTRNYIRNTDSDHLVWLPLGAVVASCVLADAVPMVDAFDLPWPHGPHLRVYPDGNLYVERPGRRSLDISGQRLYGDFAPGRWAWLLEDVKPTTERCPACWGEICGRLLGTGYGDVPCVLRPGHDGACNSFAFDDRLDPWCPHCCGLEGGCPPIPAKGHQRLWEWTP